MVIKPVGQSGVSSELASVGAVDAASGAQAAAQASAVSAASEAASRAVIQAAVDQAGAAVRAGEIGFAEGVSRVISAMANQQVPAGLEGALREGRVREFEQVFADDPRVAASVERLLRAAAS